MSCVLAASAVAQEAEEWSREANGEVSRFGQIFHGQTKPPLQSLKNSQGDCLLFFDQENAFLNDSRVEGTS